MTIPESTENPPHCELPTSGRVLAQSRLRGHHRGTFSAVVEGPLLGRGRLAKGVRPAPSKKMLPSIAVPRHRADDIRGLLRN